MKRIALPFFMLVCASMLSGCIGTSSKVARANTATPGSTLWYAIDNPGGMTPVAF